MWTDDSDILTFVKYAFQILRLPVLQTRHNCGENVKGYLHFSQTMTETFMLHKYLRIQQ